MIKRQEINSGDSESPAPKTITLKWSEILERAFEYYYTEYIPAWALS